MGRGNEHRHRRRLFDDPPTDLWGGPVPAAWDGPSAPQPRVEPAPSRTSEAWVKWFNATKGFGFVELIDGSGEAFLHIRQVAAAGHDMLAPGTTLTVHIGQGPKGRQVERVVSIDNSTAEPATPPRGSRFPSASSPDLPATVKWFDPAKGFGFVTVAGEPKDVFVHIGAVKRAGLSTLEPGQALRVSIIDGRKGREVGALAIE